MSKDTVNVQMTEDDLKNVLRFLPSTHYLAHVLESAAHALRRKSQNYLRGTWRQGTTSPRTVIFSQGNADLPVTFPTEEMARYIVAMRNAESLLDAVLAYWEVGDHIPDDLADEIRNTLKQAGWTRE